MSAAGQPDPARRKLLPRLRRRVRAYAARLLAMPRYLLKGPVRVKMHDRWHRAELLLAPLQPAHAGDVGAPQLGRFYSPVQERAVLAIAAKGPLQGKQIAAALGMPYGTEIKVELRNLVARGALVPIAGEGYSLASGSLS